jgi:hypothetical protein
MQSRRFVFARENLNMEAVWKVRDAFFQQEWPRQGGKPIGFLFICS